jgi:hypothetical protein
MKVLKWIISIIMLLVLFITVPGVLGLQLGKEFMPNLADMVSFNATVGDFVEGPKRNVLYTVERPHTKFNLISLPVKNGTAKEQPFKVGDTLSLTVSKNDYEVLVKGEGSTDVSVYGIVSASGTTLVSAQETIAEFNETMKTASTGIYAFVAVPVLWFVGLTAFAVRKKRQKR